MCLICIRIVLISIKKIVLNNLLIGCQILSNKHWMIYNLDKGREKLNTEEYIEVTFENLVNKQYYKYRSSTLDYQYFFANKITRI